MWEQFKKIGDMGSHYPIHPAWGSMEVFIPNLITDIFSANANGSLNDETIRKLLKKYDSELQNILDSYQ